MANALDALIDRIPDEALRGQIREALKKQNQQKAVPKTFPHKLMPIILHQSRLQ